MAIDSEDVLFLSADQDLVAELAINGYAVCSAIIGEAASTANRDERHAYAEGLQDIAVDGRSGFWKSFFMYVLIANSASIANRVAVRNADDATQRNWIAAVFNDLAGVKSAGGAPI